MHVDLDTLATALYVKIDDGLTASSQLNPDRPKVDIAPRTTVAVLQVLLGHHNELRWLRWPASAT